MKNAVLALACAGALAAPAGADEVWATARGHQIVYERDAGDTAVLSYKPEQGLGQGLLFVVGLGGKTDGRETFQGYWVEPDDAGDQCAAALTDAEGKTWKRWGLALVTFARPEFPSRISVRLGECLTPPGAPVWAQPVIGAGIH